MEFSVVARMDIWVIHWCRVHLQHRNVTLIATVTKKVYSVRTNVDKPRTAHVVKRAHEADAEQSVIQDHVQPDNYARTELAWQVAREIRTVLETDHALTESAWIHVREEKLAERMPFVKWLIIKHSACARMDSKVIHGTAACNTNVKRTQTVNWTRSAW